MATCILVPIHTNGLFLESDTLMTEANADFTRLPHFNGERDVNSDVAFLSEKIASRPLQNQNLRNGAGLHLHWSMPDALTKGVHIPNNNPSEKPGMIFPKTPNRWIVIRKGGGLENKEWVIESDFLWPEEADLKHIGVITSGDLSQIGDFFSTAWALFTVIFPTQPEVNSILETLQKGLGDIEVPLPTPLTKELTVAVALSQLIDELETLTQTNNKLTELLNPLFKNLLQLEKEPEDFPQQMSLKHGLHNNLQKIFQLLRQSKAYLDLLQMENQEIKDKLEQEIEKLKLEKEEVENIINTGSSSILSKEQEILGWLDQSNTIITVDLPAKNQQKQDLEKAIEALRKNILLLNGQQQIDQEELTLKRNESGRLAGEIQALENSIVADQQTRDDLLIEIGSDPTETILELEANITDKTNEKKSLEVEKTDLEEELVLLNDGDDGLSAQTQNLAQQTQDQQNVDTSLKNLLNEKGLVNEDDEPQLTAEEIDTILTNLYLKNKEIVASEDRIIELEEGIEYDEILAEKALKVEKETEAEALRASIIDMLDPEDSAFSVSQDTARFYITRMESLKVEIELIAIGIDNLNEKIQVANTRKDELTGTLIPNLETELANLNLRLSYELLVEKLTPIEEEIRQKQSSKTSVDERINNLTTAISDRGDLILSETEERSEKHQTLIEVNRNINALNEQLITNDNKIDVLRDSIFDIKNQLDSSKSKLVFIESEIELRRQQSLKTDQAPEAYLKRRNRSVSIPIEIKQDDPSHQPFRYMGRILPAEAYTATTSKPFQYYDQLTVIGYGEPSFAALYSNCKSVFGFHDDEASPNAIEPLNYYVFGWYAKPEDDFLKATLKDNPGKILETLQKKANWTLAAENDISITAENAQVVFYSHLEFMGLGIKKTTAQEKFAAIIQANLDASNQKLKASEIPSKIEEGANNIWSDLLTQSWIATLPTGKNNQFDAILATQETRKEKAINPELKLTNNVTITLDIDEIETALKELTTRSFKDSSVVIADTSSEALSSFLGHALVPLPKIKEKKEVEFKIKENNEKIKDVEYLIANGRAEDTELKPYKEKAISLNLLLKAAEDEIKALIPKNQATRNKIEEQLETLFFTDDLNARQLDIGHKMKEARLANRYNAVSSDHVWTIRSEADSSQNAQQLAEAAKLPLSLNQELAGKLDRLNLLQKQYGKDTFEIESGKQRLFSDWYKYMLCSYPPEDSSLKFPDIDEVRYFIQQKDISPLYEKIMETGEVQLDHLTAPTSARDYNSFNPDEVVINAIETELGKKHSSPSEPLAKRLASEINELIRAVSWNNIEQLKFKQQGKFDEIKDWTRLLQELDSTSASSEIIQLKTSLGTSVGFILENAKTNNYQINQADKEIVRNALNTVLLEEINALKELYLGLIQRVDLFLTPLAATDINNWKELASRLKILGTQNPNASIWLGLPEKIRTKLSGNISNARWSASEKSSILSSLHSWISPRPEVTVKNRRIFLESLFPNIIHTAEKTVFILKRISAPRFWEPKEPSVLIAGDIIEPSKRFGQDGRLDRRGFLECISHTGEDDDTYYQLPSDFSNLLSLIEQKHNSNPTAEQIGYHLMLSNPWNPFQLEWEVELCPLLERSNATDGDYQSDYLYHNFDLKVDDIEMRLKPGKGKVTTGRSPNIYTGRSLLTTEAYKNLDLQLKTFLFNDEEQVDKAIAEGSFDNPYYTAHKALEQLGSGIPIQSQVLSGFNQAMLMFRQSLQLPIDDPIGFEDYQGFTKLISSLIGYTQKFAPQPLTDFSPIRTGELNLHQIRVVDTFGQYRQIDFFDPDNGADVLGTALQASKTDGITSSVSIPLTPRLAQPARLDFRWINSSDDSMEMNDHTATNPICGWMMANYADLSLMIFDDQGQYLGAIEQEEVTETEVNSYPDRIDWAKWRSAIGKPSQDYSTSIQNLHLKKVVEFIRTRGKAFVEEFTDITDAALHGIEPENFASQDATVLLMGRPMALVRASVDLQFKEIHAVQQSWEAFLRDRLRTKHDTERETDDYTKVEIPVRIGASAQYNDGLIAFWKTNKEGELEEEKLDINLWFREVPAKSDGTNYHPSYQFLHDNHIPFRVSPDTAQAPQYLSMLVDPYSKVHAITGILPVKAIDIPFSHFEKALQAISLTFLAGPILSPAKKILAPLPNTEGKEWSWVEKNKGENNWDIIREAPALEKNKLIQSFSNMLWDQLVLRNWVNIPPTASPILVASSDRRPLDYDFSSIQSELESILDSIPTLSKNDFDSKIAEPGGLANLLWAVLTDQENVYWLDPYPDNAEMATIIATDERKKPKLDIEVLGVNYSGMVHRIQEILQKNRQGIFEFSSEAKLPDDRLWLRDGWLQLNNSSEIT